MAGEPIYIWGGHSGNGPTRHLFMTDNMSYPTREDAVKAVVAHWTLNFGRGQTPQYRVYWSEDKKTAFVEILDTAVLTCLGVYKIAEMFFVEGPRAAPPPGLLKWQWKQRKPGSSVEPGFSLLLGATLFRQFFHNDLQRCRRDVVGNNPAVIANTQIPHVDFESGGRDQFDPEEIILTARLLKV